MRISEMHLALSRTDSIGDVVLTLPMAGILKSFYPQMQITFIGRTYTKDIVALSSHVDHFCNWDDLEKLDDQSRVQALEDLKLDAITHVFPNKLLARAAKQANIRMRIGTRRRVYHMSTCNYLPSFSRKKSDLHESQLNIKLLTPLGIHIIPELDEMPQHYGLKEMPALPDRLKPLLATDKKNIILHPKSKGSALEWGLDHFSELIALLPAAEYQVLITGTAEEGELFRADLPLEEAHVTDVSGQCSLSELVALIARADTLVAASTGPLHIAAMVGTQAVGLFSNRRPIHPGRWMPLGKNAKALTPPDDAATAQAETENGILQIAPAEVKRHIR